MTGDLFQTCAFEFFPNVDSVDSIEFVEDYFLVIIIFKTTENSFLQILWIRYNLWNSIRKNSFVSLINDQSG